MTLEQVAEAFESITDVPKLDNTIVGDVLLAYHIETKDYDIGDFLENLRDCEEYYSPITHED